MSFSCAGDLNSENSNDNVNSEIVSPTPFNLQWIFGFNPDVPLIYLKRKNGSMVAYASANVAVIYDYKSREMFTLQGHSDFVRALSIDQTEKWLLSADYGENSTVVVWDTKNRIPIYTLHNPHEKNMLTAAALSTDAKYIVTVGNENIQVVKLWLWTFGRKNDDAKVELTETKGERVKEVCFSYENSNLFALTSNQRVVFIMWNEATKILNVEYPIIVNGAKDIGILNNTTFVTNSTKIFTGTSNGYIVVWDFIEENDVSQISKIINTKSTPLQRSNIKRVTNYKRLVVIGNSRGDINFYDTDLKILYWCRNCGLDSIASISFSFQSHFNDMENIDNPCVEENMATFIQEWRMKNACNKSYSELEKVEDESSSDGIASNITRILDSPPKFKECISKPLDKKARAFVEKFYKFEVPRDATIENNEFCIDIFLVATLSGKLMWIDISKTTGRLISHYFEKLTAMDVHPQSDYLVIADKNGTLFFIDYGNHRVVYQRHIPAAKSLKSTLIKEVLNGKIIHITNYASESSVKDKHYATVLKYSPKGSELICALNNGVMWILRPDTLDLLDPLPYKHSNRRILDVSFSECSNYMAYYDDSMTVAVFKRNEMCKLMNYSFDFLGKYRSHNAPIASILFSPISHQGSKAVPRFLSLGKDRDLIEYDLKRSGPYPDPGLRILEINRIEQDEIPLSMTWYPQAYEEKCLVISNTDYKFKIIDSLSKETRDTVLGPTFSSPVQKTMICQRFNQERQKDVSIYIVFTTNKEIGLQLLPLDGNPYRITGILGHPKKISCMRISRCGQLLFILGCKDRCVSEWSINFKSANILHRLGGTGLSPYYGLINGGKFGWLFTEMQDLFVYAQILEQGEYSMETRSINDEICVELLPSLMRSIGFYPSNDQCNKLINEVTYQTYLSTGQVKTKINFEEFVKLYINHRPAFGISTKHLQNAFCTLAKLENTEAQSLSKELFVDALSRLIGRHDANFYDRFETLKNLRKLLVQKFKEDIEIDKEEEVESTLEGVLRMLPNRISYKDFTTNIMGIESPKETRADNGEK